MRVFYIHTYMMQKDTQSDFKKRRKRKGNFNKISLERQGILEGLAKTG